MGQRYRVRGYVFRSFVGTVSRYSHCDRLCDWVLEKESAIQRSGLCVSELCQHHQSLQSLLPFVRMGNQEKVGDTEDGISR